jgi:hypothetical protein
VAGDDQDEGALLTAPPVITPKQSYDAHNEAAFREEVRRKLDGSYDRRSNLTVPFGKKLSFTSAQGQVVSFGYNADGEFTIQQDASTPFGMASISYVSSVESGLEGSLATLETSLTTDFQAADTIIAASVTTEASARSSADGALATRASALEASVDTPTTGLLARVTTTESAIATNSSAISTVSSEVVAARSGETNLLARITTVNTAAVNAGSAASTAQSEITAARSGEATLLARISTVNTAAVNAGTAASTAQSEISAARDGEASLLAKVNSMETATTSAAGAASTAQSEITAARQGEASLTAKVTALSTATSTVDGKLSASYALTVDGGGRIASMKLLSNGSTSSVKFTASTFSIYDDSSSDVAPFEVSGGVVKIKTANIPNLNASIITAGTIDAARIAAASIDATKLSVSTLSAISADLGTITAGSINASLITAGTLNVDRINTGSIVTAKLDANAVSQGVSGETDATVDVLSSSWVTLESESITVPDATTLVKVDWSFFVGVSGEPEDDLLVRIKRGSTVIYETTAARVPAAFSFYTVETGQMDFYQTFTGQVSGFDADTPGAAGTYTYTLEAKADLSTIGPWTLSRRRLFLMQFKR